MRDTDALFSLDGFCSREIPQKKPTQNNANSFKAAHRLSANQIIATLRDTKS